MLARDPSLEKVGTGAEGGFRASIAARAFVGAVAEGVGGFALGIAPPWLTT